MQNVCLHVYYSPENVVVHPEQMFSHLVEPIFHTIFSSIKTEINKISIQYPKCQTFLGYIL